VQGFFVITRPALTIRIFVREQGGVRKTGVSTPVHGDFEYDTNEAIGQKDDF
jgi:hypothetical protein